MKKADSLFQLIRSLTRGEKRNFRLLAQLTGGDKKYLRLFDAIDKQEEYDESRIIRQFRKDEAFVRQLAVNKNYLYVSILNSLTYYLKTEQADNSTLLLQVQILLEKNLSSHARKLIRKAKERLWRQEAFEELLKLLPMEADAERRTTHTQALPAIFSEIARQEQEAVVKLDNLIGYKNLDREFLITRQQFYFATTEKEKSRIEWFESHPLMRDESCALSVKSRILFCLTKMRIEEARANYPAILHWGRRIIEVYESHAEILRADRTAYLERMGKTAAILLMNDFTEESLRHIRKIRAVQNPTFLEKRVIFEYSTVILANKGIYSGAESVCRALMPEVEAALLDMKDELNEQSRLGAYFLCAKFYISVREYSNALRWINRFLNYCDPNHRPDMQCVMRLLNLLVHFELGNQDVVENTLKSTIRFIYKKDRMSAYMRRVLRFFTQAVHLSGPGEADELRRSLMHDLKELLQTEGVSTSADYFRFEMYMEACLQGINFLQLRKLTTQTPEELLAKAL